MRDFRDPSRRLPTKRGNRSRLRLPRDSSTRRGLTCALDSTDEDRPRPGAERARRRFVAPRRRARRRRRTMARPRGGSARARRRPTRPSAQQRPLPPADHDPRRAPRSRPAGGRPRRPAGRGRRRAVGRIGPRLRPADPSPIELPRLLRLRAARRHHVETPRHGDSRGVVSIADLLLQQRVRDPRSGRPGARAAWLGGAGLRAGGGRPHRHAGPRPRCVARRGGDRRLHGPQRLERARPAARREHRPAWPGQGQGLCLLGRPLAGDPRRACRCPRATRGTIWR